MPRIRTVRAKPGPATKPAKAAPAPDSFILPPHMVRTTFKLPFRLPLSRSDDCARMSIFHHLQQELLVNHSPTAHLDCEYPYGPPPVQFHITAPASPALVPAMCRVIADTVYRPVKYRTAGGEWRIAKPRETAVRTPLTVNIELRHHCGSSPEFGLGMGEAGRGASACVCDGCRGSGGASGANTGGASRRSGGERPSGSGSGSGRSGSDGAVTDATRAGGKDAANGSNTDIGPGGRPPKRSISSLRDPDSSPKCPSGPSDPTDPAESGPRPTKRRRRAPSPTAAGPPSPAQPDYPYEAGPSADASTSVAVPASPTRSPASTPPPVTPAPTRPTSPTPHSPASPTTPAGSKTQPLRFTYLSPRPRK